MTVVQWILVAWITLNALILFYRGSVRERRTYTMRDGVLGVIESALAIVLVATL